jgi:protein O-GlcNAc transferase
MTQRVTLQKLMDMAVQAHQAGKLGEAESLYRQFIAIRPEIPDALNNLGNVLMQLGRYDEAIQACSQALASRPDYAEAYLNIGMALQEQGRLPEAIEAFRQVLAIRPDFPEGLNCLATALQQHGQLAEAIAAYRQAIALRPGYRDALNNLGNTLREAGELEAAVGAFQQTLVHHPVDAEVLNNLGTALENLGHYEEAEKVYRRALAVRADFPQALYNLGNAFQKQGLLDDAIASYRSSLEAQPDMGEAWINLGNALRDAGQTEQAFEHYRRGIALKPDSRMTGTLLYALHSDPAISPEQLREAHAQWNRQYAEPLRQLIKPHDNDRSPERRLRIGYVSPDLGNHPVGRFMQPLLLDHDREQFEIYCYSDTARFDPVSSANRSRVDVWRTTSRLPDELVAGQIRQDRIDVLIDLTMHSSENRMLVFARKPAPVQVTYLAYPGTTGLETIDYRLTDPYIDPPGDVDREKSYSEKSFPLPHTFWCYAPFPETGEVGPLPASSAGQITFGCLNSFSKVSSVILDAWIRILREVSNSRLLVYARQGAHRERTRDRLRAAGIDPNRLDFVNFQPTADYLRQFHRIDIALDTFPYAGGTTTCDALWMGVPVVSLAGQTAISRGGLSILSNISLGNLVASDIHQYVQIAKQAAMDRSTLAELRSGMRARMLASPLMDPPGFARDIEAAYRQMWRQWCANPR